MDVVEVLPPSFVIAKIKNILEIASVFLNEYEVNEDKQI